MNPVLGIMAQIIAEMLIPQIIEKSFLAKLAKNSLQIKIKTIIEKSLTESIANLPNQFLIWENFDTKGFLAKFRVKNEIQKLLSINEKPSVEVLVEEWRLHAGNQHHQLVELFLSNFLDKAQRELLALPEIGEIVHRKENYEAHTVMQGQLTVIDRKLTQLLPDITNQTPIAEVEIIYESQLDTYRNLLRKNNPKAALDLLMDFTKKIEYEQVSNAVRARVISLIGSCHLELGNVDEACQQFIQAIPLAQNDPVILANAALAYLQSENYDKSLDYAEQSLAINGNGLARAIKTEVLAHKKNYSDLDSLVEDDYLDQIEYVFALGLIFKAAKQFDKAEKYLRMRVAQKPKDVYGCMELAIVIIEQRLPENSTYIKEHLLFKNADWDQAFDESLNLMETAISNSQTGDNKYKYWNVLASAAGILAMKGDVDKAKQYCDTVLQECPNHLTALHNRTLVTLYEKEYGKAVKFIDRLPKEYLLDKSIFFAAVKIYALGGKPQQSEVLLKQYPQEEWQEFEYISAMAWFLIKQSRFEEAVKIKESLLSNSNPMNATTLQLVAQIESMMSNHNECIRYLKNALDYASPDERRKISLHIALELHETNQYEEVAQWFEKAEIDTCREPYLARIYINSLYVNGEYGDAYRLAQDVRLNGYKDPFLMEMESWIAEYLGDLLVAVEMQNQLAQLEPANNRHVLQLARLEFRLGNIKKASEILHEIDPDILDDPLNIMICAELFNLLEDYDRALSLAYKARYLGINIPDVHLAYVRLFLQRDDETKFNVDTVGENTAVRLVDNHGNVKWCQLITLVEANERNWEYPPDSYHWQILEGHRLNDTVQLKSGPLEEIEFTITEIQSIYVRAFQETLEDFGSRFPQNPYLHKMRVDLNNPTSFFHQIAKLGINQEHVVEIYRSGQISVEQFSHLIGRNQVETFLSLQGVKKEKIYASVGTSEDQTQQYNLVRKTDDITLTISSIFTIAQLNLFDAIINRFKNIYLSQRMIVELETAIQNNIHEKENSRGRIGYENGKFYFNEIPPELFERHLAFLEEVKSFMHDKCTEVPISPKQVHYLKKPENPEEFAQSPGSVSMSSILVAQQTQSTLYSDEKSIRRYAYDEFGINGFWSQPLLNDLHTKKIISLSQLTNAYAFLLQSGYFYSSVNSDVILCALEEDEYKITQRIEVLISGLQGPYTLEDDAIRITAKILKKVWLESILLDSRILILDRLLQAIVYGRQIEIVLYKLTEIIRRLFALAPLHQDDILSSIQEWQKVSRISNIGAGSINHTLVSGGQK